MLLRDFVVLDRFGLFDAIEYAGHEPRIVLETTAGMSPKAFLEHIKRIWAHNPCPNTP